MRLRNFYLIELIMLLNYAVLFEQRPLSPKNTTKPWISGEICANSKKRQNCYLLVRQNKMSHQFYSRFRNFVTNQIRQTTINYFPHKFKQFKGDCKILEANK